MTLIFFECDETFSLDKLNKEGGTKRFMIDSNILFLEYKHDAVQILRTLLSVICD